MMNNSTLVQVSPLLRDEEFIIGPSPSYILPGVVLVLIMLLIKKEEKQSHWTSPKSPPGPPTIPILGHIPLIGTKPHIKFTEWAKYYGNIFRIQFGSHPAVIVNDLQTIRSIILTGDTEQRRAIAGRPQFPTLQKFNGGYSMTFSSPTDHSWAHKKRWMRQAISNYLAAEKDTIEQNIITRANFMADDMINKKITDPHVSISTTCIAVILDMACKSVQGDRDLVNHKTVNQLSSKFFELNDQTISPIPDLYPCLTYIFKHTIRRAEDTTKVVADLIAELLQDHVNTFDEDDLRDLTDHFLKACHSQTSDEKLDFEAESQRLGLLAELLGALESTAGTILRWSFLYAAAFPEEQALLHEELRRVVGNGPVTLEHERHLVRMKAFLAEVKRRSVVMPFLLPHCTVADTHLGGYDVPKDTLIFFNVWSALRDSTHWDRPEQFEPQRFISNDGAFRYDLLHTFLHFGGGERRCIGQRVGQWSVFLLFANVLNRCKILPVEGENYDLDGQTEFTLNTKPYRIEAEPF